MHQFQQEKGEKTGFWIRRRSKSLLPQLPALRFTQLKLFLYREQSWGRERKGWRVLSSREWFCATEENRVVLKKNTERKRKKLQRMC